MPGVFTYNRLVISGPLYAQERFNCTWHFGGFGDSPDSFGDLTDAVGAIAAYFGGLTTSNLLRTTLGSLGAISEVTLSAVQDGRTLNVATASVAGAAGTGTSVMPPQVALVTSLLTDNNTRSGRGRFYWPVLNASSLSQGRLSTNRGAWLTTIDEAFDNIAGILQTVAGGDLALHAPVIYSRKNQWTDLITRLRVNDVLDTQRRRSWSLIPASTTANYIVGSGA